MPAKLKSSKAKSSKAKSSKAKKIVKFQPTDESSDDDILAYAANEEEFLDENKFNSSIKFHIYDPEKYKSEIRKEIIITPRNQRRTSEVISLYEFADVVSNRAKQIEDNSIVFVDVGDEDDPIKMGEMEVRMRRCPLSIFRMVSENVAEIWDVNEMTIPY
jgi:DNA-directed RNA polymerase subunit K/omega